MAVAIGLAIAYFAIARTARAQSNSTAWPMFHHDAMHTGLSAADTSSNSGTKKWAFDARIFLGSSPVIGPDGTIYVGSRNHRVYAVRPNGKRKWSFKTNYIVDSALAIGPDGTIYVGNEGARLNALRPDGRRKWFAEFSGSLIYTPTIDADGTIYVGTYSNFAALTDNGSYASAKWFFFLGADADPLTPPAIGGDGTVYFGCSDHNLYALNPDGTLKWKFSTGGAVYSAPAIGTDGTIYFGSDDGNVYALTDGGQASVSQKWVFATGWRVESSPAIGADGTIYIGSWDFFLYALSDNGKGSVSEKWAFNANSGIDAAPAIGGDGTIYFGISRGQQGTFYALSPDGSKKWSFDLNAPLGGSAPAIGSDGTIYVGAGGVVNRHGKVRSGGQLYAIGTPARR
jgi:outer membrane protein assembly factor BamB